MAIIDPESEHSPANQTNVVVRALSSLRTNGDFRYLWLSNLFYIGGNWSLTLVLGWLVFDLTGSELLLAIFTAARLAPLWLGPISGLLADRYNRVLIIKVATMWATFMSVVLGVFILLGYTPFWLLLISGFLIGLAQSPSQPARSSLALQLVGRKNLANANALGSMGFGLTQAIAPALAGLVLGGFGAAIAMIFAASWYLVATIIIWQVKAVHSTVRAEREPMLPMLVEGVRIIARNRLTTTVILITLAANIFIWPITNSFLPVFASDILDLGPAGLGRLMMFMGIGNFIGSFAIATMGDFRYKGGMFVMGSIAWGVGWSLFGLSESATISYGLMLVIGFFGATFGVLQATLMLMTSAPEVQGRALGILELAVGTMPIGTLVLGIFANAFGAGVTTAFSGALFAMTLVIHMVRVPDLLQYTGYEPEDEPPADLALRQEASRA